MRQKQNKLISAAAGSGKTKKIIDEALSVKDENVLITTYTEANEQQIINRIINIIKGYIPPNISVKTWFSVLLEHGVKPYQGSMEDILWDKNIGFILQNGTSSTFKSKNGKIYSKSKKTQFHTYYFSSKDSYKINSDKVSEFVCECDDLTQGELIKRLSKIFPNIYIDEIQDLAGYDLELLKKLFKSEANVMLVGDPRQGTYSTNESRKNSKYKKSKIIEFFEDCKSNSNLEIDNTSLSSNYRSNQLICDFSNKLFTDLPPVSSKQNVKTEHDGIFFVKEEDVKDYIDTYKCIQLRWNSAKESCILTPCMNYGESKGLDFERVLIYPTTPIIKWIENNSIDLADTSKCKFYVAITRAKHSVGIVYNYNKNTIIDGINKYKQ